MTHNAQQSIGDTKTSLFVVADSDGDVLEVNLISDTLVFQTHKGDETFGTLVCVQGEDLFALREVLAELPERAFVRPIDPADTSWADGDYLEHTCGSRYIRQGGKWHSPGTNFSCPDETIDEALRGSVGHSTGMKIRYKKNPVPDEFASLAE